MKFREHRGSFKDSLATYREIENTISELKKEIEKITNSTINYTDIKIINYPDDRVMGDNYIVTVKNFGVIGFIDSCL